MSKKGILCLGLGAAILVPALTIAAVRIFIKPPPPSESKPPETAKVNNSANDLDPNKDEEGTVTTSSGLQYLDRVIGKGEEAVKGKTVTVHYTGRFLDGRKFDSSLDTNDPYRFVLGTGNAIKGWHIGIEGMKVGGKRKLVIPYKLAYGETGRGKIPPKTDLRFEVELMKVQ